MSHYNRERNTLFIHVPKTGGTSMERHWFVGGNGHAPISQYQTALMNHAMSWAFVRNPYDRILSVFHAAHQHKRKWPNVPDSFDVFLRRLAAGHQMVNPHQRPMVDFLCDPKGAILVDFVGRFEEINRDWNTVCKRLQVLSIKLEKLNSTEHHHWRLVYREKPELQKLVAKIYQKDFETFNYGYQV